MVRLWRAYLGGMGLGHLPEAGGLMDQAAIMMDAFAAMSNAQYQIDKRYKKDRK